MMTRDHREFRTPELPTPTPPQDHDLGILQLLPPLPTIPPAPPVHRYTGRKVRLLRDGRPR
jgi:hypothetical protein